MQPPEAWNSIDHVADAILAGRITARTSRGDATVSCDEQEAITDALAAGELKQCADLLVSYIGNVQPGLTRAKDDKPPTNLRPALELLLRKQ